MQGKGSGVYQELVFESLLLLVQGCLLVCVSLFPVGGLLQAPHLLLALIPFAPLNVSNLSPHAASFPASCMVVEACEPLLCEFQSCNNIRHPRKHRFHLLRKEFSTCCTQPHLQVTKQSNAGGLIARLHLFAAVLQLAGPV